MRRARNAQRGDWNLLAMQGLPWLSVGINHVYDYAKRAPRAREEKFQDNGS